MSNNNKTIIVETKCGPVRGILRKSFMGDAFYSFKQIPYAEPPLGNLRFKVCTYIRVLFIVKN